MEKLKRNIILIALFFILSNIIVAIIFYYVLEEGFSLKRQLFTSIPATTIYFILINYIKKRRVNTSPK